MRRYGSAHARAGNTRFIANVIKNDMGDNIAPFPGADCLSSSSHTDSEKTVILVSRRGGRLERCGPIASRETAINEFVSRRAT